MGDRRERVFRAKTEVKEFHEAVLLQEVVESLKVAKGKSYIDATVGGGGHTQAILERGGRVLAVDWDREAIRHCAQKFKLRLTEEDDRLYAQNENLSLVWGNFIHLAEIAGEFGFTDVYGMIFDLGVSSHQLEEAKRGFSFQKTGQLDMRMDPDRQAVTAESLVNNLERRQLEDLFFKIGQEKYSRAIAGALARARLKKPIETTAELSAIIRGIIPRKEKIDPATRVFMALRIAVNSELLNLEETLPQAVELLTEGGMLAVVSFHSLEDRIVKNFMRQHAELKMMTKKPIVADLKEIKLNPRARSAKLRIAQKIH